MNADDEEQLKDRRSPRNQGTPPAQGGAVYGLGLIGALVWFWGRADNPADRVRAVLKAIVWPAFLVHDAFRALQRD